MRVLVAIKRVVDGNVKVQIKPDGTDVNIDGAKMGINPYDEHAIEEALRLKEKGIATEVLAVSIGTAANQDVLRHALAMGVDRAILVESELNLQPLAVAKILKTIVLHEEAQLILLGKQTIDDDTSHTGPMLAALLDYPQGTFASALVINKAINKNEVVVTREIDSGTETLALSLPAVITTDQRLNAPRFVKLPSLMMARKKVIERIHSAELGLDLAPRQQLLKVATPTKRKPGIQVKSVTELLNQLRVHGGLQ